MTFLARPSTDKDLRNLLRAGTKQNDIPFIYPTAAPDFEIDLLLIHSPSFLIIRAKENSLHEIESRIDIECCKRMRIKDITIGAHCLAPMKNADANWKYSRARIIRLLSDHSFLYFVDEGRFAWTHNVYLKKTPIDLVYRPQQTIICSLDMISPVNGLWNTETVGYLRKFLAESHHFTAVVRPNRLRLDECGHCYPVYFLEPLAINLFATTSNNCRLCVATLLALEQPELVNRIDEPPQQYECVNEQSPFDLPISHFEEPEFLAKNPKPDSLTISTKIDNHKVLPHIDRHDYSIFMKTHSLESFYFGIIPIDVTDAHTRHSFPCICLPFINETLTIDETHARLIQLQLQRHRYIDSLHQHYLLPQNRRDLGDQDAIHVLKCGFMYAVALSPARHNRSKRRWSRVLVTNVRVGLVTDCGHQRVDDPFPRRHISPFDSPQVKFLERRRNERTDLTDAEQGCSSDSDLCYINDPLYEPYEAIEFHGDTQKLYPSPGLHEMYIASVYYVDCGVVVDVCPFIGMLHIDPMFVSQLQQSKKPFIDSHMQHEPWVTQIKLIDEIALIETPHPDDVIKKIVEATFIVAQFDKQTYNMDEQINYYKEVLVLKQARFYDKLKLKTSNVKVELKKLTS